MGLEMECRWQENLEQTITCIGAEHSTSQIQMGEGQCCSTVDWMEVNTRVHKILDVVKSSICNDRRWDKCKKYFNMYELVSSTPPDRGDSDRVSDRQKDYVPASRSFFKLTELLHNHADIVPAEASRCSFLCDAPGGFVEAFVMFRRQQSSLLPRNPYAWMGKDVLHAISLIEGRHTCEPGCDTIPAWRLPREMMRNNNIYLHGGDANGNGDLYRVRNIDTYVSKVGEGSCDLVTADGGFDFSDDFNSQERASLRLVVSETYTALRIQAEGGAFVIKIYDICLPETLRLLWHMYCAYPGGVSINKPNTSRTANSEKFVVCKGFVSTPLVLRLVEQFRCCVCRGLGEVPLIDGKLLPPTWFMREIALFNTAYIARQSKVILDTLAYMHSTDLTSPNPPCYPCVDSQLTAASAWRARYQPRSMHHPHQGMLQGNTSHTYETPQSIDASQGRATCGPSRLTVDTHNPSNPRSLSPSSIPNNEGELFPGRKHVAGNCDNADCGGLLDLRFVEVEKPASGTVGTVTHGDPKAASRPEDHPPFGRSLGRPSAALVDSTTCLR